MPHPTALTSVHAAASLPHFLPSPALASPVGSSSSQPGMGMNNPPCSTLFVANLGQFVSEHELKEIFARSVLVTIRHQLAHFHHNTKTVEVVFDWCGHATNRNRFVWRPVFHITVFLSHLHHTFVGLRPSVDVVTFLNERQFCLPSLDCKQRKLTTTSTLRQLFCTLCSSTSTHKNSHFE